jgi:hypothetical protein
VTEEIKDTEQTAVAEEAKEEPKEATPAESGAAQTDGLDELLKEFDQRREATEAPQVQATEPKPEQQIDVNALAVLEKRLNDQEARSARRELEQLFDRFTDGVQADNLDAEAFLNAMALRDPRINQAYMNRGESPKRWNAVESELKKDFSKRFGKKVDRQVTDSRDAVTAAVRSASTAAPQREITAETIASASKDEFDEMQRKLGVIPV